MVIQAWVLALALSFSHCGKDPSSAPQLSHLFNRALAKAISKLLNYPFYQYTHTSALEEAGCCMYGPLDLLHCRVPYSPPPPPFLALISGVW